MKVLYHDSCITVQRRDRKKGDDPTKFSRHHLYIHSYYNCFAKR